MWKSRLKLFIIIRWGQGCICGGILVHEYVTTYWQLKKNIKENHCAVKYAVKCFKNNQ